MIEKLQNLIIHHPAGSPDGYRKLGTHARVFSQTLTHGNRKIDIRQTTGEEGKKRGVSIERSKASTNKRTPGGLL